MRKLLAGIVLVLGLSLAAAIVIVTYGSGTPYDQMRVPPVAAMPQEVPESERGTSSPKPVDRIQPVSAFHPRTMRIYQVGSDGDRHDLVPVTDMDKGQLDVDSEGNVVHYGASGAVLGPREAPGVVVHWSRAWPGTDTGTTEINCHARAYPPMVCTPLMDMAVGADPYSDKSHRVELTGPDGQVLVYVVQEVIDLAKGDIVSRPELNDNIKDRLLIYTCQVYDDQPIVDDRVVVAMLVSSKAGV